MFVCMFVPVVLGKICIKQIFLESGHVKNIVFLEIFTFIYLKNFIYSYM